MTALHLTARSGLSARHPIRLAPFVMLGFLALVAPVVRAQLAPGNGTGLTADANTVALYRFEDTATTALDSSVSTRDATVYGTTAGTGLFGSGRIFDGVDDRLELGTMFSALTGSSAWTIEYFAKSNDGSNVPYLTNANPSAGWYFVPASGSIGYGVKTTWDGNSWNVLTSVTAPTLDTAWHYYALTFTEYGALSVYRDGTFLGSSGTFGSWSGSNSYGVWLDYDSYWTTYNGAGVVDDLRFSNVARSAGEIQAAYNLAAIPEPSTYAALAGLVALGLAVWRGRANRPGVRAYEVIP